MKTYHLTSFWKYYLLLSGALILWFIIAAVAWQGKHLEFLFVASLLGLADTALAVRSVPTFHIVISEDGVIWHGPGFTLGTKWEDIETISHHVYGFSVQEGLASNNLMVQINNKGIGYLPTPWQVPPVKPFIPLSCFGDNWRNSELGTQIKQFAPHLF